MFDSGRPVVQITSIKLVANGLNSIGSLDSIRNHLQIVNKNLFKLLVPTQCFLRRLPAGSAYKCRVSSYNIHVIQDFLKPLLNSWYLIKT